MIRIENDPIRKLVRLARKVHPKLRARVQFVDRFPARGERCSKGLTLWPDDGGTPIVFIKASLPFWGVVDILAHELAHAAAGHSAAHGPKWKKAYEAIHRAWMEESCA